MSYRDKLYSSYVTSHTSNLYGSMTIERIGAQFPTWRSYFQRFLPVSRDVRILDIGCGNGAFVHFLHESGYQRAEGFDVSPEQVEESRRLGIPGITCADSAAFLSDKHGAYDIVFARDVIEHLHKDEVMAIFAGVHQALKPGGKFVVQVPNAESPISGRIRYGDFTHELGFTQSSLNQIFAASGYTQAACYGTGPAPHGFISAGRFLLWKVIETALRVCLFVETGSAEGIFTQTVIAEARKGAEAK